MATTALGDEIKQIYSLDPQPLWVATLIPTASSLVTDITMSIKIAKGKSRFRVEEM